MVFAMIVAPKQPVNATVNLSGYLHCGLSRSEWHIDLQHGAVPGAISQR
jgi:hypothetical protein